MREKSESGFIMGLDSEKAGSWNDGVKESIPFHNGIEFTVENQYGTGAHAFSERKAHKAHFHFILDFPPDPRLSLDLHDVGRQSKSGRRN